LFEVSHEISAGQKEALQNLKQQADIIQVFVRKYIDLQQGNGTVPAYSQVAKADRPEDQAEQTIKAAEMDLLAEGIDKPAILNHRGLILEWLQTVVFPSKEDDEVGPAESPPATVVSPNNSQKSLLVLAESKFYSL
jgi:hypothetical protein